MEDGVVKENYIKISLIQQREIEMKVLGPVIRAFCIEFGKVKTLELVKSVFQKIAEQDGREFGEKYGNGLKVFKEKCVESWHEGNAMDTKYIEDLPEYLCFDVTRCDYAALYKKLGFEDIGTAFSCSRDPAFIKGFDDSFEFIRTKTLMEGGDCCDFCYRKIKGSKHD